MNIRKEELLKKILMELQENSKMTEKEIAQKFYYSERTIRRYFKILKDRKIIVLITTRKNREWKVIKK